MPTFPPTKGQQRVRGGVISTFSRCQAKIRKSDPPRQCKRAAMEGKNVCRLHGGASPGRPVTSGTSIRYLTQTVLEKHEAYLNDPDLLDLTQDVANLRAMWAGVTENLEGRNFNEKEMAMGIKFAEQITRTIKTYDDITNKNKYNYSPEDMRTFSSQIVHIINTEVKDEDTKKRIAAKILGIKVKK